MPDRNMNVVILSTASFPWGMAATNRVRCLAKGMMAENIDVEYIGLCGADVDNSPDKVRIGQVDGIKYSYPGGFAVRPRSWLIRRVDDFLAKSAILIKLVLMKLQGRLDAVLIYSRNHATVLFWSRFLHLLRIPVVLELCEWPLAIAATNNSGFKKAYKFCHDAVLSVDGVIPISSYIEGEVFKIAKGAGKLIPSFRVPILIDIEETNQAEGSINIHQQPYLLYIGAVSYFDIAKHVVDISEKLEKEKIGIKIKFTGGGSSSLFDKLKEYARSKGVLDNFEFTGFVRDEELSRLMRHATALLAPIPENLQSVSRFPTKLGYYLASGRPVITNAVGDVNVYLQDGNNAFVAPGCRPEYFAARLRSVLDDPESAGRIGINGRKRAIESFHYRQACRGIREFITSLQEQ